MGIKDGWPGLCGYQGYALQVLGVCMCVCMYVIFVYMYHLVPLIKWNYSYIHRWVFSISSWLIGFQEYH